MPLITKSEYARVRGCTPAAVSTAFRSRINGSVVVVDGKELLDLERANELWEKNTQIQPPPTVTSEKAPSSRELQAWIQGLPEDQIPDLNDSRARREHYQAELARLEALRGREELVPADQVKAEAFARARAVRDALLGLADRLAPILAATTDARECHRLLTEEHRVALRGLADG